MGHRHPHGEGWCRTCGSPVTLENKCDCRARVADALERYLGMDLDTAAQTAAVLWAGSPDQAKEYVWSGRFADDHDVGVCPPPAGLAALCEQDARDCPLDDPCPRCGRRQWTDEHHQDTCQACGWTLSAPA